MATPSAFHHWRPSELLRRVGDIAQLASVTPAILDEGRGRGARVAWVRSGSGFSLQVLVDRGMDIGLADWRGVPLAWRSPVGDVHPAYFEPEGYGWLRSFGGGLLTTCGLSYVGGPVVDGGDALGLHGRFGHTPAAGFAWEGAWEGDDYVLTLRGEMSETAVFGPYLVMQRELRVYLGAARMTLRDRVQNRGFRPAEHQILYHINLGFPVVEAGSYLAIASRRTEPRDAAAAAGRDRWHQVEAPAAGFGEQVFFHDVEPGPDGWASAAVINPNWQDGQGLEVRVRYRQAELPHFVQWKMLGEGEYVVGLEPANCTVLGRPVDRERGILRLLAPGEVVEYALEIQVAAGTTLQAWTGQADAPTSAEQEGPEP